MHLLRYGCAAMSAVEYGLACMELGTGESGARSFVSVQGSLAMFAISHWGWQEQNQQWLPLMARGETICCLRLTEPDFGSDPAGMRTCARRDGGEWVLEAAKTWITNGSMPDVAVVWAPADAGIQGFLVPTNTAGFTANKITSELSLRGVRHL
jgi:glutaryl-CoA dehydrogenase